MCRQFNTLYLYSFINIFLHVYLQQHHLYAYSWPERDAKDVSVLAERLRKHHFGVLCFRALKIARQHQVKVMKHDQSRRSGEVSSMSHHIPGGRHLLRLER